MFRHKNTEVRQRSISTNTDLPFVPPKENRFNLDDTFEVVESTKDVGQFTSKAMSRDEKEIYELQLTHLQDQLEEIMIEKENQAADLKKLREVGNIEDLKGEIDLEKQKYNKLEKKYRKLKMERSDKSLQRGAKESEIKASKGNLEDVNKGVKPGKPKPDQRKSMMNKLWEKLLQGIYEVMDDFSEDVDSQDVNQSEGDPLTVKTLKANIKRLGNAAKPYLNTAKGFQNLLKWKSPAYTLIVFMVYLYAVWQGWLLQVILMCLIFRLFVSYLQSLGMKIMFNFFDPGIEEKEEDEISLGISEKVNLVFHVARKAQNAFGAAADGLEKIQSVLTWRHKQSAKKLFSSLCWALVASMVFPSEHTFIVIGLGFGFKMFVINYFYDKYPRLKRKYDSAYKMWQELPTEAQWVKEHTRSEIDKYIIVDRIEEEPPEATQTATKSAANDTVSMSSEDRVFCQLFSLPFTECPVKGWRGGKRCSLVNKDKNLMSAFKNGKLYLTKSFICFERKKTPSKSNMVIPLADIINIKKAKPFSAMFGSGFAIEISIKEKSFTFGGLINRDDAYDNIIKQGRQNDLPWALGLPVEENNEVSPVLRRRTTGGQIQNFSFAVDYEDSD